MGKKNAVRWKNQQARQLGVRWEQERWDSERVQIDYQAVIPQKKGRGYIAAGILIASLLSLNEFMRFRHRASSKFFILNNEFYILSIGLILAAFNQVCQSPSYLFKNFFKAATSVVATGVLVCNCVDEFGLDVWLSMGALIVYGLCYLISNKGIF